MVPTNPKPPSHLRKSAFSSAIQPPWLQWMRQLETLRFHTGERSMFMSISRSRILVPKLKESSDTQLSIKPLKSSLARPASTRRILGLSVICTSTTTLEIWPQHMPIVLKPMWLLTCVVDSLSVEAGNLIGTRATLFPASTISNRVLQIQIYTSLWCQLCTLTRTF